ncbi:hypothetical protein [Pseudosporangium ferrugineum]|uniref:Uncharacterized protein n=1 Tax=Pseudosporangium ferrugineum TaxID=439699 RepID=A0A2T0S1I4_9ACTN|nr:hypothetical protein [Pseudosporangium ferrugineum]PRY27268.1 hypothetical protein CLV70_111235 [Pseudosporangium ferrugineum]
MLRNGRRRACALFALVVSGTGVLAGCGEPPAPPLTAPPPGPAGTVTASASAPGYPPVVVPTTLPTGVLPPTGLPNATLPTVPYTPPPVVTTPPTTSPATPAPPPAPKCTGGPSPAQIVAVVEGTAGIPDRELKVIDGPFCSGTWQFATIEIVARRGEEKYEPLFVVTTGSPAALQLVEAGTDVCSKRVRDDAPPGVRVRACGA